MQRAMVDRLIESTERNSSLIAEEWFKALRANPRTSSFNCMSKDGCLRHAVTLYKNLAPMYFAENCFQAVENFLEVQGFVEDYFARGIPLEEVIYALVLMRRQIWVNADRQAIWNPVLLDMYQAVESNNRVLLIFDYATYIAARKYHEMAGKTGYPYKR
jgi:hypothetical protein